MSGRDHSASLPVGHRCLGTPVCDRGLTEVLTSPNKHGSRPTMCSTLFMPTADHSRHIDLFHTRTPIFVFLSSFKRRWARCLSTLNALYRNDLSIPRKCKACRAAAGGRHVNGDQGKPKPRKNSKSSLPNAKQLQSKDEHGGNQKLRRGKKDFTMFHSE